MLLGSLIRVRGHTIYAEGLYPGAVVIDGGAHMGEFSLALTRRYQCRCYLVEANPRLVAKLIREPFAAVVAAALSAVDGRAPFFLRANPEASSLAGNAAADSVPTVEVESVTLATLVRRVSISRIDVLKLDVEGAEFAILENAPEDILRKIGQISVEFHDFLPAFNDHGAYERVRSRLKRLGFLCCPMSFRTHGDVLFLNTRHFKFSRSGQFAIAHLARLVVRMRELAFGARKSNCAC